MFSEACVKNSVHMGGGGVHPPLGRQPPFGQTTPRADTSPRQTLPHGQTPPGQTPLILLECVLLLSAGGEGSLFTMTVRKRAVDILNYSMERLLVLGLLLQVGYSNGYIVQYSTGVLVLYCTGTVQ